MANADASAYLPSLALHAPESDKQETSGDAALAALFEGQAVLNTQQVAIVDGNSRRITFGHLDARANRLAHYKLTLGASPAGPGYVIALMLDKSMGMLVCVLAVWKAGVAYVPLDPDYPALRVGLILDDTRAALLITTSKYSSRVDCKSPMVDDADAISNLERQPRVNTGLPDLSPSALAYIIFTSGTTGRPKGVMVEHRSVVKPQKALAGVSEACAMLTRR